MPWCQPSVLNSCWRGACHFVAPSTRLLSDSIKRLLAFISRCSNYGVTFKCCSVLNSCFFVSWDFYLKLFMSTFRQSRCGLESRGCLLETQTLFLCSQSFADVNYIYKTLNHHVRRWLQISLRFIKQSRPPLAFIMTFLKLYQILSSQITIIIRK